MMAWHNAAMYNSVNPKAWDKLLTIRVEKIPHRQKQHEEQSRLKQMRTDLPDLYSLKPLVILQYQNTNYMDFGDIDLDLMGNPSFELGDHNIKFIKDGLEVHKYGLKNILGNEKVTQFSFDPANLKIGKQIGKGASSEVYQGQYFANGTSMFVAVKVINVMEKKLREQILSDIKNFIGSSSPNLVTFYGCYYEKLSIKQIFEYMDLGSLRNIINLINQNKIQIEEKVLANITRNILKGLKYIHEEKSMIHRDIKPENILLNSLGEVKIADFGISKITNDGIASTFVGTLVYMSPERVKPPTQCSYKSDIWSVGLMIYELATGDNPYKLTAKSSVVDKILGLLDNKQPELSQKSYSFEFRDFMSYCLCKDLNRRCLPDKLLTHHWIQANEDDTILYQWVEHLKQNKLIQ